jgi:hypothetical protein
MSQMDCACRGWKTCLYHQEIKAREEWTRVVRTREAMDRRVEEYRAARSLAASKEDTHD